MIDARLDHIHRISGIGRRAFWVRIDISFDDWFSVAGFVWVVSFILQEFEFANNRVSLFSGDGD